MILVLGWVMNRTTPTLFVHSLNMIQTTLYCYPANVNSPTKKISSLPSIHEKLFMYVQAKQKS